MTCDDDLWLLGDNSTDQGINFTGNRQLYEKVYNTLYRYGLPFICVCGFLGNVMNLIILAGKRVQHSLRRMERSANIGLIALAVADMSFCISAFPSTFLPLDYRFAEKGPLAYYACYCAGVINIFIFTSTWLTVAMSMERYLAISHPLKSRNIITLPRTKVVIVLVYVLSALFNVPVFWRYTISEQRCSNRSQYMVEPLNILDANFDHAYRALWAMLGNFIPLFLLLVCNVGLMRQIQKSYAMRRQMNGNAGIHQHSHADQETNNRITITLIAIVLMFLVLVAPSEILKHAVILFFGNLNHNYTYMTCEIVTNLMQTVNFSANFILYCIINPSFRKTMREMFCFRYQVLKQAENADTSFVEATYHGDRYSSLRLGSVRHQSIRASPPRYQSTRVSSSHRGVARSKSVPSRYGR
ncbi:hypothetical protein LSH36_88g04003 [Paralvinella palmiformis]|uniref:G-protein coupled receptors family 1 profile domain-containing protein n=1 Tax=Paralvinella palmiformis TaxID=53620 RepID=A0AAD9K268_9ANNE|nr:hypothetical protein LSH36_88g04003 [Paralvinella palmiformis]